MTARTVDPGRCFWFDLPAANLSDAMSFYEGLFGWKYLAMDEVPEPDYVMISAGGVLIGGIRRVKNAPRRKTDAAVPILYFSVDRLGPKSARARELGAILVGRPVSLGHERGHYQWLEDREKNLVALWAPEP